MPIANKIAEGGYGTNPLESRLSYTYADSSTACMDTATLSINGSSLETDPMTTPEQLIMAGYKMLFKNLGQLLRPNSCSLEYEVYKKGAFFLLWDLTVSQRATEQGIRHRTKEGGLRLHLGFDNTLKEAVDLNIISFYNSNVICDKARNISYAYLA